MKKYVMLVKGIEDMTGAPVMLTISAAILKHKDGKFFCFGVIM